MTTELDKKLDDLINKAFKIKNLVYKLNSWRQTAGKFILETDRRTFVLYTKELEDLLLEINIVENHTSYKPSLPTIADKGEPGSHEIKKISLDFYEPNNTQKELQEALLNSLKLVQENPKHIPQAKSVCDIANTLINIEKNQINMMNAAKRSMSRE